MRTNVGIMLILWVQGRGMFPEVSLSVILYHTRILCQEENSVFGEQRSDGWVTNLSQREIVHMASNCSKPYGLSPLSLSPSLYPHEWSIIIQVRENIIFTGFHISQSQPRKWSGIKQSDFSYQHPKYCNNISNSLAELTIDRNFPKQSHFMQRSHVGWPENAEVQQKHAVKGDTSPHKILQRKCRLDEDNFDDDLVIPDAHLSDSLGSMRQRQKRVLTINRFISVHWKDFT